MRCGIAARDILIHVLTHWSQRKCTVCGLGVAFLAIVTGHTGCSSSCTYDIACPDVPNGFAISLKPAADSGLLPPGTYVFEIGTDKESVTLTCDRTTYTCTGGSQNISATFDPSGNDIYFSGQPHTVTIQATRNGVSIGSGAYTAEYAGPPPPRSGQCAWPCGSVSVTPDPILELE